MKYLPIPRRPAARPSTERRTQPRNQRDIWSTAMREDYRMHEFLAGVQVHDIEWSEWQDSLQAFERH